MKIGKWELDKFLKVAIPATIASLVVVLQKPEQKWQDYIIALLIGIGTGFGFDTGYFVSALRKDNKENGTK